MVPSLLQNAGGGNRERRSDGERGVALLLTVLCSLPQLLEGLVYVLLQNLLHALNQRHLFIQLLVGGVHDELVPSPAVPQCQAFSADPQGNGGRSQGLLRLLLRLRGSHRGRIRSVTHRKSYKMSSLFPVKSPGSERPSLRPVSVHSFPAPLCTERHPRPGRSACERCPSHPRLSAGDKKTRRCVCRAACRMRRRPEPTLQPVWSRSDLPSSRMASDASRSFCAAADSRWLLESHSDTLWRRPGFAESAHILLLRQTENVPVAARQNSVIL